jgi:predicted ferric reductase
MHQINIIDIQLLNHNVYEITCTKPVDFFFRAGQAVSMIIGDYLQEAVGRPFTVTSLPTDSFLQFVIKVYPERNGFTEKIPNLKNGDILYVSEPWGQITYQGPGIFLAAGTGITPFWTIFKKVNKEKGALQGHKLFFANSTKKDIFLEKELRKLFEKNSKDIFFLLDKDEKKGYLHDKINLNLIKKYFTDQRQKIYICGPEMMVTGLTESLLNHGILDKNIVTEK